MQFELNKTAVFKRLNYAKELLKAHEYDKTAPIKTRRQAEYRIRNLRELIQGKTLSKAKEVYTSIQSVKTLLGEVLEQGQNIADPKLKAKHFLEMKNLLDGFRSSGKLRRQDDMDRLLNIYEDDVKYHIAEAEENIREILTAIKNDTTVRYADYQDSILNLSGQIKRITENEKNRRERIKLELEPELKAMTAKYKELDTARKKALEDGDSEKADKYSKEASKVLSDFSKKQSDLMRNTEYSDHLDQLNQQKEKIGKKILNDMKAVSTVTEQDAQNWVNDKLTITKQVKNKIKAKGMDEKQFIEDLKQFYILTNGRLGRLIIDTKNHNRAYAEYVESYYTEGVVMLDNDFKQEILFHELAHHLESDQFLRKMASQYIKTRSVDGGKRYRLNDLTNSKDFKNSEIAYKTDFPNAYTGKIYSNNTTELLAMSAQYLYNPINLVDMISQDPEQIELFTALMAQPKTELTELSKELRDEILDIQDQLSSEIGKDTDELIKKLADKVSWSSGTPFNVSELSAVDRDIIKNFIVKPDAVATVHTPTGRKFVILEGEKIRYQSYLRGVGQKGYIALDIAGLMVDIDTGRFSESHSYFAYFTRLNFTTAFPIQTRNRELAKVLLLALTLMGEQSLMYKHTKGIIGEGFLGHGVIEQLAKVYL